MSNNGVPLKSRLGVIQVIESGTSRQITDDFLSVILVSIALSYIIFELFDVE